MARSPLTLAAAVTAALPDAEVTGVAPLTAGGADTAESVIATLSDGRRVLVRVANTDARDSELAAEALALRALSEGARALLPFAAPEFLGAAALPDARAFLTTLIPGFQIDVADIPAGPGAATVIGSALAQLHALPVSIVRAAGLPARSSAEAREDATRVLEESGSTGRVPVRLMVRWREAIGDDAIWQFEPTVTLGGAADDSFIYDDPDGALGVTGVIGWHGLSIGDPAVDLQFLATNPGALAEAFRAYSGAALRAPDAQTVVRARLHAELEFARWLLHGRETHDDAIIEDATAMLDALADSVRDDMLLPDEARSDLDHALAALDRVPAAGAARVDTTMHTDVYDPRELAETIGGAATAPTEAYEPLLDEDPGSSSRDSDARRAAALAETQPFDPLLDDGDGPLPASRGEAQDPARASQASWSRLGTQDLTGGPGFSSRRPDAPLPGEAEREGYDEDLAEADRAARAAISRWTSSDSDGKS